eukprot:CAMPEP_0179433838 /NCGR_PEP_ID=MMETSP0799-20121207/18178_1 /TAXON_ID=46947 /ORGANISM="Geminigera cryophila, Strain CCMP2564" /LENGTH=604 /DNA_ID=CAMNT_0021212069 /DNA_START=117 /DNA_END=1931 /DNA_ORIENTATION=+
MAKMVIDNPIWQTENLQRVPLFKELPRSALHELESMMQLASIAERTQVLRKGQKTSGMYFVVSGMLEVGGQRVGAGGHCCVENVMGLVQHFSSGLHAHDLPTTLSLHDVVAQETTTCLVLSALDLATHLPLLRALTTALIGIEECTDDSDDERRREDEDSKNRIRDESSAKTRETAANTTPPSATACVAGDAFVHHASGGAVDGCGVAAGHGCGVVTGHGCGARRRERNLEDLEAQRNELVRKLEVAKVQAKKEELRLQVRNLTRTSSAGAHHNIPRIVSCEALEHRGAGGSPKVKGSPSSSPPRFQLSSPIGAVNAADRFFASGGGGGGDISLMPRSHSEGDQQQRELLEEKARLQKALRAMLDQQQLRAMLHQHDAMLDSRSTPQPQHLQHLQHAKSGGSALCADTVDVSSPPGAVPGWRRSPGEWASHETLSPDHAHHAAQDTQQEPKAQQASAHTANRDLGIQSNIHASLHGVIPLPHAREVEKVSKRLDGDLVKQLERHRSKWGAVWESSYYFNHVVYRRNQPKRGIPVDTSGDGQVDSLAFDITGDGKVDLIISDAHSAQVALEKHDLMQQHLMQRSHSDPSLPRLDRDDHRPASQGR